jgi:hypothetical protein
MAASCLTLVIISTTLNTQVSPANNQSSANTAKKQTLAARTIKRKTTKSSKPKLIASANSVQDLNCRVDGPVSPALTTSEVSQMKKLYEYEKACGGKIIDRMMLFEAMPATVSEAKTMAADVAFQLKEFKRFGISPLVIWEPNTSKGLINFQDFANGSYDAALGTYFQTLVSKGINSQTMGMWVSFPEANIPVWQTTNPDLFATCVTRTAQLQKKYFSKSQASILLESKTYTKGWSSGSFKSLSPYVKNIPKGLIDSFGYQGFPWPDPQPDYNAGHYLNPSLAVAAAKQLAVKSVWFNTGTFNKGKAYNGQTIKLTPSQRQTILNDILKQAKAVKANGFNVAINLFAENKYNVAEGIDWSYWPSGQPLKSDSTAVFKTFVHNLKAAGMQLWLFDADD